VLELLLADDPRDPCWELPRVADAYASALLGWRPQTESVDAGVPAAVAAILADVLCGAATVTFLGRLDASVRPTEDWRPAGATAWVRRAGSRRLMGRSAGYPLIGTRAPDVVAALFEQDAFPWHLRGQAVLLSDGERPPPKVSVGLLRAIFGGCVAASDCLGEAVDGLLLPAVDGDFAGLYTFTQARWSAVIRALEAAESSHGTVLHRLTEREMKQAFRQ
jgi:hypothetical protein